MCLIHLAGLGNCCHLHWLCSSLLSSNSCWPSSEPLASLLISCSFRSSWGPSSSSSPHQLGHHSTRVIPTVTFSLSRAFLSITLAFRGYRVFSCDISGNWALLSLKRFLLFRRKNKFTDHVNENRHIVPYGTLVQPHFNYCNILFGENVE